MTQLIFKNQFILYVGITINGLILFENQVKQIDIFDNKLKLSPLFYRKGSANKFSNEKMTVYPAKCLKMSKKIFLTFFFVSCTLILMSVLF